MEPLSSFQIDALKEVGSMGMGNAATSLSKLVGKQVQLNLSNVQTLDPDAVARSIPESITMTGVMLRMTGDIKGVIMLLLEFNNAVVLSNLMLVPLQQQDDPVMCESALCETGNILAGSYLNVLFQFLDLKVIQSAPITCTGTITDVLEQASELMEHDIKQLLNIETMFMVHDVGHESGLNTIYGDMFLLLDSGSLDVLLSSINNMIPE